MCRRNVAARVVATGRSQAIGVVIPAVTNHCTSPATMSNGMQLMGVGQPTQQIVRGLVLLMAVAFDVYNKRRAGTTR